MPDVRFDGAVVRLPGFTFGPVSVTIDDGLTAVVGVSGAGKSTLIGLAAGIRAATEGAIFVDGMNLAALPDGRRAALRRGPIAFAAQQPLFLGHLDLTDNLAIAARLRVGTLRVGTLRDGTRRVRGLDQIAALLDRLGLGDKEHRRPAELSGGELSRANTARAFLGPAALVCLDEPTAMLDEVSAEMIRALLAEEASRRKLLVATHDPDLIAAARRVIRLDGGRMITA